jgi:superfamily II DNA or RNA helicase
MPKAVLAQRIYLSSNDTGLQKSLLKELTYFIPKYREELAPDVVCNLRIIDEKNLSIPSGRVDLIPDGYEIIDKRICNEVPWPEFNFTPRPEQQEIIDRVQSSCLINASPAWGKAQPLHSKIKTKDGWVLMGDIKIGDKIVTPKNTEATVTGKFYHKNKDIYKIITADGRVVEACSEHLWQVFLNKNNTPIVLNTAELLSKIKTNSVYLPLSDKIEGTITDLPIHPYVLGILLGDGGFTTNSITLSSNDTFIIDKVNSLLPNNNILKHKSNYDYQVTTKDEHFRDNSILKELRNLQLLGLTSDLKFIPNVYMNATIQNRLHLIQGLMDSDGYVEKSGTSLDFTTTSYTLATQFQELIFSLGGYANIQMKQTFYTYKGKKLKGKQAYKIRPSRLSFDIKKQLCSLPRKADLIKPGQYDNVRKLKIQDIVYKDKEDCACISIDSPDKLYLTDSFVVTHNTFTGIAIARKLRQKTLVIIHTQFLRDQWEEEVVKTLGIKPGIVGGAKKNFDAPIVIANIQKLQNIQSTEYNKLFGTVIVDESHHTPASTFSEILDKMHARFKIGLTASKRRKDGKHVMFADYFSKENYIADTHNSMTPVVHRLQLPIVVRDGPDPWATKINELSSNPAYQRYISTIATAYAKKGHKVLVVSSRTDLLKFAKAMTDRSVCITGEVKDGSDRKDLVNKIVNNEADIIFGSINIFAEGISVNPLSCLVLATPMNNDPLLEQVIGRITRKMEGKLQPVVVDIRLAGNTVFNQGQLRDGYYLNNGYTIIDV